jgi:hypothetical protein
MDKPETKPDSSATTPTKWRGIVSLILTLSGVLLFASLRLVFLPEPSPCLLFSSVLVILGLLSALKSLYLIKKSQGSLRGKWSAITAVVIAAIWVTLILSIAAKTTLAYIRDYRNFAKTTMTYSGSSADLSQTTIVPTLDTPSPNGKNIIWCSSFQLAWNELKNDVIREPVQVIGAEALAERLNTAKQSTADLLAESYYAAAGVVGDGIVPTIQSEMAKRFPSEPVPQFNSMPPDWIIAYSYLEAYIKFTTPFRPAERGLVFTDSQGTQTKVDSFGIWDCFLPQYKKVVEQVNILYYRGDPNDYERTLEFAVDLCKFTQPYQVVVACIPPKHTLAQTLAYLQDKIAGPIEEQFRRELGSSDTLLVPNMFWKITHHFQELEGKNLANPGFEPLPLVTAYQMIQFRLDRTGAILKSEALLNIAAIPRDFICDRPFLIYLKKRDAKHPFFVMWVDNAELLTEFPSTQPAN